MTCTYIVDVDLKEEKKSLKKDSLLVGVNRGTKITDKKFIRN